MTRQSGEGPRSRIVNVRYSPEQADMLERLAAEDGITVSKLVRRAVSMYVFEMHGRPAYKPVGASEKCQCGHTRAEHESRYDDTDHCNHRCVPPWWSRPSVGHRTHNPHLTRVVQSAKARGAE